MSTTTDVNGINAEKLWEVTYLSTGKKSTSVAAGVPDSTVRVAARSAGVP